MAPSAGGQELRTKRGEVEFRRKLAEQQTTGRVQIPEAHTREEIVALMRARMDVTRRDMDHWRAAGVTLGPFVELGAERGQRSLVLVNEYGVEGFAADISFEMLRFADVLSEEMGFERRPVRVACDAYNLPVSSHSLRFAFAYQTLHHFPDPTPVCAELARVLAYGGGFFITDEPIASRIRSLARVHHRKGHRLNPLERLLDKAGLLTVLTKADELEAEHHVLEEEFTLDNWRMALAPFQDVDILANRRLRLHLDSLDPGVRTFVVKVVGGNIHAYATVRKEPDDVVPTPADLADLLVCPDCPEEVRLVPVSDGRRCPACDRRYPEVENVLLLFGSELGHELYPEYFPAR